MDAAYLKQTILTALGQVPDERHTRLAHLHSELLAEYLVAVKNITPEQAAQPINVGDDTRTLAQIVGHIAEWDRFSILAAGDLLAGIQHPRLLTEVNGYIELDGTMRNFASVDAFNAYQAQKHARMRWEDIRDQAFEMATMLHRLLVTPLLLSADRLEATNPYQMRLHDDERTPINRTTMGWGLWLLTLEHIGLEHAAELGTAEKV